MMDKLQELLVWCGELQEQAGRRIQRSHTHAHGTTRAKQELRDERRGINIALDMVCDKMKELMQ
jgi:hypothetical protein